MSQGRRSSPSPFYLRKSTLIWILTTICILYLLLSRSARSSISLKELLSVSIEAAIRGGHEVKAVREKADIGQKSKGKTAEGANNPVTDGDMLSHRAMSGGILKAFPSVHIVSEESDSSPLDLSSVKMPPKVHSEVDSLIPEDVIVPLSDVRVWIDPLDATQEYTEGLTQYVTTMVCVAVKGQPVIGVIYKPFSDTVAWGWAGSVKKVNAVLKKDFMGGQSSPAYSKNRFIVSRSHAGDVDSVAKKVFGPDARTTPAGGAGYKVWEVVKGAQDAYIHVTLIKKWDICPGNAILSALGGRLSNLKGEDIDYANGEEEKNPGGVLAALHDHGEFVTAFKNAAHKG